MRFLYLGILFGWIVLIFLNFYLKHQGVSGTLADTYSWFVNISLGVLSFLITFLIIRDSALFLWWLSSKLMNLTNSSKVNEVASPERRTFLSGTVTSCIAGGALSFTGCGVFLAKKMPEVKWKNVPVKNLLKELNSFTIAQITDIHLSGTCKRDFLERVVEAVNKQNPDMIALTGDLADGVVEVLGREAEPLKDLIAPHGKFFVTGNHEYYYNAEKWITKVENMGFVPLINSNEMINYNGKKIMIAGITDYRAEHFIAHHRSDPKKAIQSNIKADIKILLAHQPKSVFKAEKAGFDIQLSGHTHGGQFFPWQLAIGIDQPYLAGLYKHKNMLIYVSRGTGYWGPPVRMGAPSEISLLKLVRQ